MINRLLIKNYAIIEELEVKFSDHLTIITGETGAGKSILLGALGLIMGKRADIKSLYNLKEKCIVEAYFQIARYKLNAFFDINDIDYDDELVIRREITPTGKSRAFINDTPVKLKTLQSLSSSLLDLHQQFDNLDIHNVSFQLRMIDALANNKDLLANYQKLFFSYQKDKKRLEELEAKNATASREIEFISFQLQEFENLELVAGEQEASENILNQLNNAEEIKRNLGAAFAAISDDEQSVVSKLEQIYHSIDHLKKFNPKLNEGAERLNGLILELQDIGQEFESIAEATEYDGKQIVEIQDRLHLIYKLQHKHHVKTIEELIAVQTTLESQLSGFDDISGEIEALRKSIIKQEKDLSRQAKTLNKKRAEVIPDFEKNVHRLLAQLSMKNAQLKVEIQSLEEFGPTGQDEVQFLFNANKGSRLMPIKDVASGGELSRLTLCTKSLVASAIPLPTLIFDEIDTGISGDVALKMGKILYKLAKHHQVISITHSPQIAVKADFHYFVYKKEKADRTVTRVKMLNSEERVRAVATMLSGNPPSESAMENARELLMR